MTLLLLFGGSASGVVTPIPLYSIATSGGAPTLSTAGGQPTISTLGGTPTLTTKGPTG